MKKLGTVVAVMAMAASLFAQDSAKPTKVARAKNASAFVGTWKVDMANSKLHDAMKTESVIITAANDKRVVYHGSMTDEKGKTTNFRYSGMTGKDATSYMGGKPMGKESWKFSDPNTMTTEQETNEAAKVTGDCKLTDDGKTMTCNWHTVPKSGDGWDEVYVMHKS